MGTPRLTFAIPPSMGSAIAGDQADGLRALLEGVLEAIAQPEVYVAESYAALSLDLMQGRCDLAWAPPSVCARLEVHGGGAIVQSVRAGRSHYRSLLLRRDDVSFSIDSVHEMSAAWVDPDSTGGYLLACAWFARRGVDVRHALKRQRFLGSYRAAVEGVATGEFELTSVFATSADAEPQGSALDQLPREVTGRLEVIDYTPETPNDGVVARPGLDPGLAREVAERLCAAGEDKAARDELDRLLHVNGFLPARADAYRALHELVLKPAG
jgi:phosphonate transport system substrate-binding protein